MAEIPTKVKEAILNLKERLKDQLEIEKMIIFGSYASGKFTEESDIDVCIIANNIQNDFAATITASGIAALVDPHIEPVVYSNYDYTNESNFGLLKEIKNTGIEI